MPKTTRTAIYPGPDGTVISFPVATIEGDRPGKHFVVTAGLHGSEYPGIAAAIRLFKETDPADVTGKITVIPIQSLEAFERRAMFVCPVDGKNPNRFFPGDKNGSYTDRLAHYLLEEYTKGDYHVDLHGGDMVELLVPFSIYHGGEGNDIDRISKEIADYYGLPHIVETASDSAWTDTGTSYANAAKRGVPSTIVEAGGIGQLDEASTKMHLDGLRNVLRRFGVLAGEAVPPPDPRYYSNFVWVYTPEKGIYYTKIAIGDQVEEGQVIGVLEDYFGGHIADIKATATGKVLFMTSSPAMAKNGLVVGIGV